MSLIQEYHKDEFDSLETSIRILKGAYDLGVERGKKEGKKGTKIHFAGVNQAFATFAKVFSPILPSFQNLEPAQSFFIEMMPFLKLNSKEGKMAITLHYSSLLFDLHRRDEKWLSEVIKKGLDLYLEEMENTSRNDILNMDPSWIFWIKHT